MDPQKVCCQNPKCSAQGRMGQGDIKIHSHKDQRYRCTMCGKTFTTTKGTPFYRLHKDQTLLVIVATLLAHGCPRQAIVAAYDLDERTVADWQNRAGRQCQAVQQQLVQNTVQNLDHVQADEICVKGVGQQFWMAMAMVAPTRLWLGGVVSRRRDTRLIKRLVGVIRGCWNGCSRILVCVDGLSSYLTQLQNAFRFPVRNGKRGRPRLVVSPWLWIGRVIKERSGRCVVGVHREAVRGSEEQIRTQIEQTQTGSDINTAYIERLNGTFRNHLTVLTRRGRSTARKQKTLRTAMNLVGCAYNFCWCHDSLRQKPAKGESKHQERTPAMAAGITDHCWTMSELLWFRTSKPLHA